MLIIFVVMFINGLKCYIDFNLWIVGDGLLNITSIFTSPITTILDMIRTTRSNQINMQKTH